MNKLDETETQLCYQIDPCGHFSDLHPGFSFLFGLDISFSLMLPDLSSLQMYMASNIQTYQCLYPATSVLLSTSLEEAKVRERAVPSDQVSEANEAEKVIHSHRQEQFWAEPCLSITGLLSFPPGLLKFISAIVPNIGYSIWFTIQLCPWLQICDTS